VEEIREKIAKFLNTEKNEIFFTSGVRESVNIFTYSFGFENFEDGDEIILCPNDNQSTTESWYALQKLLLKQNIKIKIRELKYHYHRDYNLEKLKLLINKKLKLLLF